MLTSHRQNTHRSKLPPVGDIGHIVGLHRYSPKRRCIVSHFPLSDAADQRYCCGIHTVWLRFLDNGQLVRVAWQWFRSQWE